MYGCMSTETTSMFLQINNFIFSDRRHNFSSTPEKNLKRGGIQKITEGRGVHPSHSDEKSYFILKINHQIF